MSLVSSCLAAPLVAGSLWMGEPVVTVVKKVNTDVQHGGPIYDMVLLV